MTRKINMKQKKAAPEHRILVIPDLHAPFVHRDALHFCEEIEAIHRTNQTIFLGDEIDSHAVSNYTVDADGFSAGQELDKATKCLQDWFNSFPEALVCNSNHTMRPWNKMAAMGLPKKLQPRLADVLGAPTGWKWADHHIVDDIVFEHGHSASGGKYPYATLAMANMKSTVIGHHHGSFGLYWHKTPHTAIFGMGVGCLIDETAYAFAYGRQHKRKPILGAAAIIDGHPILFKMFLNKKGRWDGKLRIEYGEK